MATFHFSLKIPLDNEMFTILVMCGRHLAVSLLSKDVGMVSSLHDLVCIVFITLPNSSSVKG